MKERKLSLKDELFCQYYAKSGQAFGNARKAYALAFKKDLTTDKQKGIVDTLAGRLLSKVIVYNRVEELMKETISDEVVDNELDYVIKQKENLHAKVSAISERNKVRGRITQKHKFEGVDNETLTERLADIIAGGIGNSEGVGDKKE